MLALAGLAGCAMGAPTADDIDARVTQPDGATAIDAREGPDAAAPPDGPAIIDAAIVDAAVVDAPAIDAAAIDAALPIDGGVTPDAGIDGGTTAGVVFASTQSTLYRIDPVTYAVTQVGAFGWPSSVGTDAMADIAVAADGAIVGASGTRLYRCSATTAACTVAGNLAHTVNALTFVPAGAIDPTAEVLVGAKADGTVLRIDPSNGAMTTLGHFSSGHSSSGDLAFAGGALVAAVNPGGANDSLARVNVTTGATTVIGPTNRPWVWGLAATGGRLIGFTLGREIVSIDPATGVTTGLGSGPVDWYGAAGR